MKRLSLVLAAAAAYIIGFGFSGTASSPPYNVPYYSRDYYSGYFTDGYDTSGDDVLQNDANDPSRGTHYNGSTGAYDAIPPYVDTPSEFINYIISRLNSTRVDFGTANNATNWDRTGAAFLIQTMIGTSRNRPPTGAEITEWQNRINHAASLGHINWGTYVSAAPNTFYQISRWDGSSSVNDVAWYGSAGTGTAIVFYKDDGSVAYIIRRNCGNPLGQLQALSDDVNFSISASSAVNNAAPLPNQTIQFTHSISSSASTGGRGINWTTQNMPSGSGVASGTTGAFGGAGSVGVGTENYPVPNGTPAGTQICRRVAYNPANQGGGSGASAQACATVQYAYDLQPTVAVSSSNAQDGDTVTFTYRVQNTGGNDSPSAQCYNKDGPGNLVGTSLTCSSGQTFAYNGGVVTVGTENVTVNGLPAGTRICRTLYIQPATPSVPNRASSQTCVVVAKVPYVRFGGNDVWAGGGFPAVTPACNISAKITTSGRALSSTPSPMPYTGQYYSNMTLSGSPTLTRLDPTINFDWGTGAPAAGLPVDNFSVRWTKTDVFTAGTHNFTVTADDGVRVYVDGVIRLDKWIDQPATTYNFSVNLTAGNHTIVMEYYENGVYASAQLGYTSPPAPTQYAGSSVEYSAYALNRITSFGSAGRVLVGSGALGDLSRLMTFANNEANPALLGYYGASQHCLQDYSSLYSTAPTAGLPTIATASSGAWRSTSSLTLSGAMPAGSAKVYYVQGNVTINGNITYPASYANYASIPSLVVIATGDIYVAPGVTQLNGMYVSRGTFYTCYPKPVPNTVNTCNTLLTVNGAVIAGTLDLYRTFGGDGATIPAKQAPAELFNFNPELYLRNALLQTAKPSMQVLNSIELPPRY